MEGPRQAAGPGGAPLRAADPDARLMAADPDAGLMAADPDARRSGKVCGGRDAAQYAESTLSMEP
ncbi:hypothetical protein SSP531S_43080 [Streptomyces spongiicola]|uniref:Uncharacterized protein n=1 Tax=Streptomyces spongiicola TaxID=1690221 RepID=A0A388T3T0_9ACTN|nr:hypothetical protein SSP531S_43080 [Streptomyces spongiicola]